MAISSELADTGDLTIRVTGRFDFSSHQAFRDSYEQIEGNPATYRVDMREATYLDSSALGMLLLLRDFAGGDRAKVEIVNCSGDVRKILSISNFEQLFTIH